MRFDLKKLNQSTEAMTSPEIDPQVRINRFKSLSEEYPPVLSLASALGMTRSALSRQTGISLSTLAKWDSGAVKPHRKMIGKILAGTPITPEEFIDALLFWRERQDQPEKKEIEKVLVKKKKTGTDVQVAEPKEVIHTAVVSQTTTAPPVDDWDVL